MLKSRSQIFKQTLLLLSVFCAGNLHADTLYWVGGIGNWSDLTHWATSSGGTTLAANIPGPTDDVVFDQNSFGIPAQTVFLDLPQAACRTMTWTDVTNYPILNFDNSLQVFGSLIFNPNMTITAGHISAIPFLDMMSDQPGNVIDFAGIRFGDGISGAAVIMRILGQGSFDMRNDLLLGDNVFSACQFAHLEGTFRTNGHKLECNEISSGIPLNSSGYLDLSTSEVKCVDGTFNTQPSQLQADSATLHVMRLNSSSPFICEAIHLTNYNTTQQATVFSQSPQDSVFVKRLFIEGNGAVSLSNFRVSEEFDVQDDVTTLKFGYLELNGSVNIPGSQGSVLTLGASSSAFPFVLHRENDTICLAYIAAGNVHATGSAVWNLNATCNDLGNNQGNLFFVNCNSPMNVDPFAEKLETNIYPTVLKSGETIHLQFNQPFSGTLRLIDPQGKTIAEKTLSKTRNLDWALPLLPPGIYLIHNQAAGRAHRIIVLD